MSTFYSLPTAAGEAELAGALAAQQTVPFTHIAVGDGNGAPVVPDGRSSLVNKVDQVQITSIRQHPVHANWLVLEAAIPEERGGYTIRELAVIGGRVPGKVLAIGNYPETEKATASSGAASALILRMVVAFEHGTAAVNLSIDPQAYATLQTVLDQMAAHEAKVDPHPQYMTAIEAGAMVGQGLADHLAAADPHAQYWTSQEGQAAVDAAMTAHLGAADPHPQYINGDRLAQSAANNWAEEFFRTSN